MKTSYRDEIKHYINTITDDALIDLIKTAFITSAPILSVKHILFEEKGNELEALTSAVLTTALQNLDKFLDEKIEDSEKLDKSLFVLSASKLQSIVNDMEFTSDCLASSVKIYEVTKEEIAKTIVKEQMLGNNNIIYTDVENSYIASVKNITDDTITINIYASQFSVKPSKFIITAEDMEDESSFTLSEIYNSEYETIDVYINADNKEDLALASINKNIGAEKKELIDELARHLGNLFGQLGITSALQVKYIAARIATQDTDNLKQKLKNFDDETMKEVIKLKKKEAVSMEIIKMIQMYERFTDKEYITLNVVTLASIHSKYSIRAVRTSSNEMAIDAFAKEFNKEEIKEIFSKVKEHYEKLKKIDTKEYIITYMMDSNIIEV